MPRGMGLRWVVGLMDWLRWFILADQTEERASKVEDPGVRERAMRLARRQREMGEKKRRGDK